ncbi:hypothetical protein BC835DRAFT_1306018 [Cytidiella melzeri]|nr:hypothetical protein BC835DRAFT_1306018 [Cytidiella melzeri]
MNFIKDLPEWFKLNWVTLHSLEKWRTICTIVSNAMTCHRPDIKAVIAASLVSSTDKNKPCIGGQDIMALHGLLTLRLLCVPGASSAARSLKKDKSYWKYVNNKLHKATIHIKAKSTSDAQAATMLKEYLDHCFKANMHMFAIRNRVLLTGSADLLPIQWAIEKFMACVMV